jgi:DNA-binding NtrC family response regulator
LEEQRFRRLGDVRDRQVDIRLIAATHHDLSRLVQERQFRSDLYFRINILQLVIPPLRDRIEDIPVLAQVLLEQLGTDLGVRGLRLTPEAITVLQRYPWPGNVRELRNVLERAVLLSNTTTLQPNDLHFEPLVVDEAPTRATLLTLQELEQQHIERALHEAKGRVSVAAKRLDIPRSSLYQKLKQYGITLSEN